LASFKISLERMNKIIDTTLDVIDKSKIEIYEIAENARSESKKLENELQEAIRKTSETIDEVEFLESQMKEAKRRLALINKNFAKFSQEDLRVAYEKADDVRVKLVVKREQEAYLIRRRNELEARIKDSHRTVDKAEKLVGQVTTVMSYLSGDLMKISDEIQNVQEKQTIGFKIILAQEKERHRIAREIHDGPAQSMSNVVLKAEVCEKYIDIDVNQTRVELKNLKELVRQSLTDVRRIIYDLRPMSLDDLGLIPTLQKYIDNFKLQTGIDITLKHKGYFGSLRPEISLTLFRIVQEALSNIQKHSEAHNAAVNIEAMQDNLNVYVYDDGKGFDYTNIKERSPDSHGGFGIIGMNERVELLEGELKVVSSKQRGTRITVSVPINKEVSINEKN